METQTNYPGTCNCNEGEATCEDKPTKERRTTGEAGESEGAEGNPAEAAECVGEPTHRKRESEEHAAKW